MVYEGDFVNDKWEGEGKYYNNGRRRYKGRMKNGYACGEGTYYDEDGVGEASGEWEYGYLNMGGNKWLNFESGLYEKGKKLWRLKDVKKRGCEYTSGMNVMGNGIVCFFSAIIGGIISCFSSSWNGIGSCFSSR